MARRGRVVCRRATKSRTATSGNSKSAYGFRRSTVWPPSCAPGEKARLLTGLYQRLERRRRGHAQPGQAPAETERLELRGHPRESILIGGDRRHVDGERRAARVLDIHQLYV